MNTQKLSLGIMAGIFALTGVATTAYGAEGEREKKGGKHRGPQVSEEVRAELKSAFENNNYTAYTAIASANEFKKTLSEEQFEEKVLKHKTKQEAREAVLEGDYTAWRTIVGDDKATDVNESNFSLLTDLAVAREAEDEEATIVAKEALKEAGIKKPGKKGKGTRGERPNFGQRNGIDKESVSEMSDGEKQDLLEKLIEQIKERLGLS